MALALSESILSLCLASPPGQSLTPSPWECIDHKGLLESVSGLLATGGYQGELVERVVAGSRLPSYVLTCVFSLGQPRGPKYQNNYESFRRSQAQGGTLEIVCLKVVEVLLRKYGIKLDE